MWAFTLALELSIPALRGARYVYRHFIGCHEADVIILVAPNRLSCQLLSAFRIYSFLGPIYIVLTNLIGVFQ